MTKKEIHTSLSDPIQNHDIWEVLVLGIDYESKNIFEEIAKINSLCNALEITEEEADKKISNLENRDPEFGIEISVIKKDNKFGHEFYGWGGADKIILWDTAGVSANEMCTGNIHWCKNIAELLCKSMNKKACIDNNLTTAV